MKTFVVHYDIDLGRVKSVKEGKEEFDSKWDNADKRAYIPKGPGSAIAYWSTGSYFILIDAENEEIALKTAMDLIEEYVRGRGKK